MIQYFYQDEEDCIQQVDHQQAQTVHWIHLSDPTESDITDLAQRFRLPLDYFTSAFDPDELARKEKLERENGEQASLIVINYPRKTEEKYQYVTRALSIIEAGGVLITAAEELPSFLEDDIGTSTKSQLNIQDSVQFTLKAVMDIATEYIQCLKAINESTEHIEKQIIESSKTEYLINMMHLKKSLVYFSTAIDTNHVVIRQLADTERIAENPKRRASLHDVQIETLQAENMSRQTLLLLEHISDMVLSIISNNLNRVMRLLTSLTLLLTIPSLIGAIWGMNVPVPWQNNVTGFWLLLILILGITAVTYYWLKKKDFF